MSLSKELLPRYTYEDYKNLQGDWELVEGIPFALASPTVKHQRVLAKLVRYLDEALENYPDCEVLSGEVFSFDPKGRLISLDFDKILGEV